MCIRDSPYTAQSRCNGVFQHIGGNARIFSDQDFGMPVVVVRQHHGCSPANVHCHFTGEFRICDASDAVRAKKSAHFLNTLLKIVPLTGVV